jgi:hypothetical protein
MNGGRISSIPASTTLSTFTVVVPTLWAYQAFPANIIAIAALDLVEEVIIIDNNSFSSPGIDHPKIKIIKQKNNIYVNPSWNLGASLATGKILCFLNDDLNPREDIWSYVNELFDSDYLHKIGLIGMDFNRPSGELNHSLCLGRSAHFGAMMFTRKLEFARIPWPLCIWYGDDFLIELNWLRRKNIFHIQGYLGEQATRQDLSVSLDGYRFAFQRILKRDKIAWDYFFRWFLQLRYQPKKTFLLFGANFASNAKSIIASLRRLW